MVTVNLAGINGNAGTGIYAAGMNKDKEKEGQVKNGSVYAGDLNGLKPDRVEQKRAEARKQATKIIMDQFASDNEITDGLSELRDDFKNTRKEIAALKEERQGYEELRSGLEEKYGITKDSDEYRDLEIIRKSGTPDGLANLNEEELKRLAGMEELTDYQSEALYYDEMINSLDPLIEEQEQTAKDISGSIYAVKQGMLENSGLMTAAQITVGKIMKAASAEIIGMLQDDAIKHIDEEFEKLVEAAKEAAEKKKEEEEKLENVREEKKEQEELVEETQDVAEDQNKLQSEIKKIMKDAELLQEDMKGLVVDGQI